MYKLLINQFNKNLVRKYTGGKRIHTTSRKFWLKYSIHNDSYLRRFMDIKIYDMYTVNLYADYFRADFIMTTHYIKQFIDDKPNDFTDTYAKIFKEYLTPNQFNIDTWLSAKTKGYIKDHHFFAWNTHLIPMIQYELSHILDTFKNYVIDYQLKQYRQFKMECDKQ